MSDKKKTTVTPEEIARFLEQTGFVFEMRMHEAFLKAKYICDIGSCRSAVEIEVIFLYVLAVIALVASQAEQTFLEKGITLIPQR